MTMDHVAQNVLLLLIQLLLDRSMVETGWKQEAPNVLSVHRYHGRTGVVALIYHTRELYYTVPR